MSSRFGVALVAALAVASLVGCAHDGCPTASVQAGDTGGTRLSVCVEVAETDEERTNGLRGRGLEDGEGLLLRFPVEDEVCIVNTGVPIAIDVLFADDEGEITALERNVRAGDPIVRCHPATRRVLEVRAGAAVDIRRGDVLEAP